MGYGGCGRLNYDGCCVGEGQHREGYGCEELGLHYLKQHYGGVGLCGGGGCYDY